jgi:hypothetical protein
LNQYVDDRSELFGGCLPKTRLNNLEEAELKPPVQAQMKNRHIPKSRLTNHHPINSPHIIIKFLDELKSILNPLLTALTSLINEITLPITPTP